MLSLTACRSLNILHIPHLSHDNAKCDLPLLFLYCFPETICKQYTTRSTLRVQTSGTTGFGTWFRLVRNETTYERIHHNPNHIHDTISWQKGNHTLTQSIFYCQYMVSVKMSKQMKEISLKAICFLSGLRRLSWNDFTRNMCGLGVPPWILTNDIYENNASEYISDYISYITTGTIQHLIISKFLFVTSWHNTSVRVLTYLSQNIPIPA